MRASRAGMTKNTLQKWQQRPLLTGHALLLKPSVVTPQIEQTKGLCRCHCSLPLLKVACFTVFVLTSTLQT